MAIGYTSAVQDGKLTEFRDFALLCARAFGALILMRDDPMDAPIPDGFEASRYHAERLETERAKLSELDAMSPAERQKAATGTHATRLAAWTERQDKRAADRKRYEAMLGKVKAWSPPTDEHIGLKTFMVQQLEESIYWDCASQYDERPEELDADAWYREERKSVARLIEYHEQEQAKENQRAAERTKWVAALKGSL